MVTRNLKLYAWLNFEAYMTFMLGRDIDTEIKILKLFIGHSLVLGTVVYHLILFVTL